MFFKVFGGKIIFIPNSNINSFNGTVQAGFLSRKHQFMTTQGSLDTGQDQSWILVGNGFKKFGHQNESFIAEVVKKQV